MYVTVCFHKNVQITNNIMHLFIVLDYYFAQLTILCYLLMIWLNLEKMLKIEKTISFLMSQICFDLV